MMFVMFLISCTENIASSLTLSLHGPQNTKEFPPSCNELKIGIEERTHCLGCVMCCGVWCVVVCDVLQCCIVCGVWCVVVCASCVVCDVVWCVHRVWCVNIQWCVHRVLYLLGLCDVWSIKSNDLVHSIVVKTTIYKRYFYVVLFTLTFVVLCNAEFICYANLQTDSYYAKQSIHVSCISFSISFEIYRRPIIWLEYCNISYCFLTPRDLFNFLSSV